MPCLPIPDGIICVSSGPRVDLKPYGSDVWCEFDRRFGPRFETKQGREIARPSQRTWAAFEAWRSSKIGGK